LPNLATPQEKFIATCWSEVEVDEPTYGITKLGFEMSAGDSIGVYSADSDLYMVDKPANITGYLLVDK
jgi:hypothetical protein